MEIRTLKKKDIRAAADIVRINYSEEFAHSATGELHSMFSNASVRPKYFVAEDSDQIIGFGGYSQSMMDYSVYEMYWINVLPGYQSQGIGSKIVSRIIEDIKSQVDARQILLTANVPDKLPKYYSTRFGFETIRSWGDSKLMVLTVN